MSALSTFTTSLTDKPTDVADELVNLALGALDILDGMTTSPIVGEATAVLSAVRAVIDAVKAGFQGDVTPEAVTAALAKLPTDLAAQDAKAYAELAAKFPAGE